DLGQRFAEEGIIDRHPVSLGQPFVTTVPLPDRDGIDQGGIRLPEIAVPVATYTGWNLRRAEIGAADRLARWSGSILPFPIDETSRIETGDPRASVAGRYRSRDDYANQITAAAEDLMKRRFLLADDISRIKDEALQRFDRIRAHPENDQYCRYTLLDTDQ
ncbi:MAG: alpha/beta hydrolase domain-containing protein, partial [Pseudomonadota bacterium]